MKKLTLLTKGFLILVFTFFSFYVAANSSITLRLNPEKGIVAKYRTENTQVITQTIGGMNQVVDQSQIVDYTMTVIDKEPDGSMVIEILINRIAVDITANGMNMKYDSDSEDKSMGLNPQFIGFSALANKSIKARFSPLGEILEVLGVEEMIEQMLEQISNGNESVKQQMKSSIESSFSSDAMQQMFTGAYIKYPEKSLKNGGSWTTNESIKNQFTLNLSNTYTLKGISSGVANLESTSTLTTIPGDKTMMQGMEMVFSLMGTQSGLINVDVETGIILDSSVNQNITGNISADMGGQAINIPMTISSQSKTSIID